MSAIAASWNGRYLSVWSYPLYHSELHHSVKALSVTFRLGLNVFICNSSGCLSWPDLGCWSVEKVIPVCCLSTQSEKSLLHSTFVKTVIYKLILQSTYFRGQKNFPLYRCLYYKKHSSLLYSDLWTMPPLEFRRPKNHVTLRVLPSSVTEFCHPQSTVTLTVLSTLELCWLLNSATFRVLPTLERVLPTLESCRP